MENVFAASYTSGQVIEATGISMSTLQNWLKRGVIVGHRDIEGGGSQGRHRRFSFYNVMEIATAAALVQAGASDLRLAFKAAAAFAHTSDSGVLGVQRHPGVPFGSDHGRTLLAMAGGRSIVIAHKPGTDALSIIRSDLGRPEVFILVDVLAVFGRACSGLDLEPSVVFEAAYPKRTKTET